MDVRNLHILYGMRILVEQVDSDDDVLLDVECDQPFLSIHAGDKIWPKGFIDSHSMSQPKPYLYDEQALVKQLKHAIWKYDDAGKAMLHHGIEVTIQNPYID
jgi:hypothetical protein